MKKYIDLSLPMVPHWRYNIQIQPVKSMEKGDAANVTHFDMQTHWYTHIDAPLHQNKEGKTLNDFPLDILIGKALLLDVSYVEANQPITADMLKKALGDSKETEFLIIKTCWAKKTDWFSYEYWDDAPYITEEAAIYLRELNPKVVGFDFPQDYDIRKLRTTDEFDCYLTTHKQILKYNILMIEYLTNLWEVKGKLVEIVALPMALENTDGAQIRVVAIETEGENASN